MEEIRTSSHYDLAVGYAAFSEGAALVDRTHRNVLRLTGKDPVGMLAAVLTNEIPRDESLGVYAALLNPKGRVQAAMRVLKDGKVTILDTEPEGADAAKEILGRYAPFSRVTLEDFSSGDEACSLLGLYGPRAGELLGSPELAEHETARMEIAGVESLVVGVTAPVTGYDFIGPASAVRTIRESLIGAGATLADRDAYETARIAAGIPRFGADITPDNFPGESESFLQRAVSFGKGCYPGQETVARMHYRGSPNKKLYRFELKPSPMEPPEAGDEILQGERELIGPVSSVDVVGWLTSVAPLPADGKVYALGYLARKADLKASMKAEDAKILSATPA